MSRTASRVKRQKVAAPFAARGRRVGRARDIVLEELAERLQLLVLAVGVDQDLRGHRVNVGGHRSNPIPEGQPANCSRDPA